MKDYLQISIFLSGINEPRILHAASVESCDELVKEIIRLKTYNEINLHLIGDEFGRKEYLKPSQISHFSITDVKSEQLLQAEVEFFLGKVRGFVDREMRSRHPEIVAQPPQPTVGNMRQLSEEEIARLIPQDNIKPN